MRRSAGFLLLLILLCSVAPGSRAQSTTSKSTTVLKGIVLGADGKAVAAAAVTCQSSAGMRPRIVHTDAKGHYVVTGLKQDSYDLRATANGAYSDWEKNIPLRKGQTKEITLHLLNGNTGFEWHIASQAEQLTFDPPLIPFFVVSHEQGSGLV